MHAESTGAAYGARDSRPAPRATLIGGHIDDPINHMGIGIDIDHTFNDRLAVRHSNLLGPKHSAVVQGQGNHLPIGQSDNHAVTHDIQIK